MTSLTGERDDDRFYLALSTQLERAESGIGFIYDTLDRLVDEYELNDAVVVLDEPPIGRQLFRAGRLPVTSSFDPNLVYQGEAGVYVDPGVVHPQVTEAVRGLCSIALRMDLLHHDASHDPLTSLLNRRSFETLLDQAVARSQRYGWSFALALLDLNSFKQLNDTHGHSAGDTVLRAIGAELRSSLRGGDIAARVGGDEFALIMNEGPVNVLETLLDRLTNAVKKTGIDIEIGFAAGVAQSPQDATDAMSLYLLADQRLYAAKER